NGVSTACWTTGPSVLLGAAVTVPDDVALAAVTFGPASILATLTIGPVVVRGPMVVTPSATTPVLVMAAGEPSAASILSSGPSLRIALAPMGATSMPCPAGYVTSNETKADAPPSVQATRHNANESPMTPRVRTTTLSRMRGEASLAVECGR